MPLTGDTLALWTRLRHLDIDGGPAAFTFRDRLAREHGWSPRYADLVVAEYRRFLLLSAVAGHPVTPSDAVNQAWHLHLTYTRSYWDDLCGRILPAPLHHGPTRGGAMEQAKFQDWYARTLASYRAVFDGGPPIDIWPPAAARFADARRFARVDTSAVWLLPKPAWWPPRRGVAAAGAVLAASVTSACSGESVVALGLLAVAGAAVVARFVLRASSPSVAAGRRGADGAGTSGCSTGATFIGSGSSSTCADGSAGNSGDCGPGGDGGGSGGSSDGGSGCGGGGCGGGGGD